MAKKQPGTMLYFDIRPCLKRLSREEKGALFEAILDYAEYGVLPEVDGVLGVAWDFIQPRLDRDKERYETISEKRTAAINARWEREREIQKNTNEYKPIQTIPTTTSPSTTTSTTPSSSTEGPLAPRPLTKEQEAENLKRERILQLMEWGG